MDFSEVELCKDSGKADKRGRRVLGRQRWLEVLSRYEGCGLTQRQFCLQEGVNYTTFLLWLGKKRRGQLDGVPRGESHRLVDQGRRGDGQLEVALPNGMVLRGHDAGQLARLVVLLGGAGSV